MITCIRRVMRLKQISSFLAPLGHYPSSVMTHLVTDIPSILTCLFRGYNIWTYYSSRIIYLPLNLFLIAIPPLWREPPNSFLLWSFRSCLTLAIGVSLGLFFHRRVPYSVETSSLNHEFFAFLCVPTVVRVICLYSRPTILTNVHLMIQHRSLAIVQCLSRSNRVIKVFEITVIIIAETSLVVAEFLFIILISAKVIVVVTYSSSNSSPNSCFV